MRRRQFVVATGTAVTATVAGCLGDGGGSNDPESVVVEFYESGSGVENSQEALDAVEDLFHTESPLLEFFQRAANESQRGNTTILSVDTVETEILEEDLSAEQLNEEYSLQSFYNVSDELLQNLAEENARVSANVTYEEAEDESSEFLTVTEDGDWVIFT